MNEPSASQSGAWGVLLDRARRQAQQARSQATRARQHLDQLRDQDVRLSALTADYANRHAALGQAAQVMGKKCAHLRAQRLVLRGNFGGVKTGKLTHCCIQKRDG